ncbi:MAG: LysR family transcriptional regulator [Pseudomonadota bacterium]
MSLSRIPSLNWLRVFAAAARAESFALAGQALHMSAPAVSQQIKALESHLGVELFVRGPRSVALSAHGRAWLPAVEHAMVSLETATDGLFGPRLQTPLHVQSVLLFAVGFLGSRIGAFQAAYPDTRLHLSTREDAVSFEERVPGLHIVFGSVAGRGDLADVLCGEHLCAVARPDIAAAIESPEDLLQHSLFEVATHAAGWLYYLDALELANTAGRFVYTDSTVYSFSLAAGGAGVALARSPVSDDLQRQFGLVPCLDTRVAGRQSYALIRPAQHAASPAVSVFRDWLLAQCAPYRDTETT